MLDNGHGGKVFTPLADVYNGYLDDAITGMANAAAFALDSMQDTDIVGTLAGDDTVLLVFHDSAHAADFCEQVRQMLR